MCGVFVSTDADRWSCALPRIIDSLDHRGPDQRGSTTVDGVLVAHTRLSVIGNNEAGVQPAASRDGSVTLVFNGEIYNFRELASGLQLKTRSDTDVLAEMLARRRVDDLAALRGMFAFVAWDAKQQALYAMRDPFGMKPLYVLQHPSGDVTLCSELPPLLLSSDGREVDEIGLGQYLALGHTGPELTMFTRIRKLQPGRLYRWARTEVGWSLAIRTPTRAELQPPLPVVRALADSVRAHMVADVEVGSFLSGGVDSTLVTLLAARERPGLRTFTLSFPEAPTADESAIAMHNARALGTQHVTVPATRREMADQARLVVQIHGEPLADAAVLPLSILAAAAARDVKVVLGGEGADELFGGYARYRLSRRLPTRSIGVGWSPVAAAWSRHRSPRPWQRAVEATLRGGGVRGHVALLDGDVDTVGLARPDVAAGVMDRLNADWLGLSLEDSTRPVGQRYDLRRWLPDVYLEKTDRATMASSLEARLPFLDPVVSAAAGTVGAGGGMKPALRQALLAALPDVRQPDRKKGLAVDTAALVHMELHQALDYELRDSGSVLRRWAGPWPALKPLRVRCMRSSTFAFRIAMLGLWDMEFDGASFR